MATMKITQTKLNRMARDLLEKADAFGLTDDIPAIYDSGRSCRGTAKEPRKRWRASH